MWSLAHLGKADLGTESERVDEDLFTCRHKFTVEFSVLRPAFELYDIDGDTTAALLNVRSVAAKDMEFVWP